MQSETELDSPIYTPPLALLVLYLTLGFSSDGASQVAGCCTIVTRTAAQSHTHTLIHP